MLGKPRRQRYWSIPMQFIACNDLSEPLPRPASRLTRANRARPDTGTPPLRPIAGCSNASTER